MIGGLILAAGAGRRFGSPKQLAELDGQPLLAHAVEAMLAVAAIERIVVVLGARAEQVRAGVPALGQADEIVVCEDWQQGMSASLGAGIAALEGCEAAIVTLGDQPLVTSQAIALIADEAGGRANAVRASYDGRPGHPAMIGAELFGALGELRGDAGARGLPELASARLVEAGRFCSDADVDEPEDLDRLRGRTALGREVRR